MGVDLRRKENGLYFSSFQSTCFSSLNIPLRCRLALGLPACSTCKYVGFVGRVKWDPFFCLGHPTLFHSLRLLWAHVPRMFSWMTMKCYAHLLGHGTLKVNSPLLLFPIPKMYLTLLRKWCWYCILIGMALFSSLKWLCEMACCL